RAEYPEVSSEEQAALAARTRVRCRALAARRAGQAYDDLISAEQRTGDLAALVVQADRFLHEHAGSAWEQDVRRRRASYLLRLDERDIEPAREYTARKPLDFLGR